MLGRRRTQAGVIIRTDSQRNVSRGNCVGWAISRGQAPHPIFEIFRHPSGHRMGPAPWQTSIGACWGPRDAFWGHHTGRGETGAAGPIRARPWPPGSPPLTWHAAAQGRRCWARQPGERAGLAGGHIGQWARWNSGLKQGDLGANGLYRKPKEIHAPKAAETLVSERCRHIYRDEYDRYVE